ncbi:MAG: PspC domain-containing protein, partial [Micromonosporaceae bacterium]
MGNDTTGHEAGPGSAAPGGHHDPAPQAPPPGPGGHHGPPPHAPPPGAGGQATGGLLAEHGLIRPPRGERQIAGVCAGIARATRTDPVLWRVLLAVGVLFGGAGLAAYLIGWLAMPEEGDSGSPLEALFGRGHSRTSPAVTVVLAVAVGALLAITVEWSPVFIVVVAALGYVIYRQRRQQPLWPHRHSPPQPPGGQAAPPYGSPAGPPPTWHAGPPPTWHPAPPATPPTPPGGPPGPPEGPPAAAAAEPTGEAPDVPAAESNAPTTASPAATDERPTQNLSAGADSEDRMAMEPTESQLTGEADQAARDEETAVLAAAARYERDTVPIEPIWPER